MRALIFGSVLFCGFVNLAHSQESFDSILVSCDKAPPESVKSDLPSQLSHWATLSCTRYGQVLRAAEGWVWHNPKGNSFVRVWAQPSDQELKESVKNNYFKSLSFQQLSPEEAESANLLIAGELGAKPQKVTDAYTLEVIDAQGRKQMVNFVRSEANIRLGTFWGWACTSPCIKPEVFMGFRTK